MYAIILTYTVPVDEVDEHAESHLAWLRDRYRDGHFLLSGQQRPRVGGFILAPNMTRSSLDAILAGDPYVSAGVGEYRVIDVDVKFAAAEIGFMVDGS